MSDLKKAKNNYYEIKKLKYFFIFLMSVLGVISLGTGLYDWINETRIINNFVDVVVLFLGAGSCSLACGGVIFSLSSSERDAKIEVQYCERKLKEEQEELLAKEETKTEEVEKQKVVTETYVIEDVQRKYEQFTEENAEMLENPSVEIEILDRNNADIWDMTEEEWSNVSTYTEDKGMSRTRKTPGQHLRR